MRILLAAVFCCLVAAPALAQPFEVVGSRALGMAGAFVAVADDATGVYWNPAGLASGQPAGAIVEWHRFRSGDPDAIPVSGPWKRTAGLMSLGTWPIGVSIARIEEVRLIDGNTAERFSTRQYGLSLLQTLTEGVVIGATLKYVRGDVSQAPITGETVGEALDEGFDFAGDSQGAFDLDLSAMYDAHVFRLGVTMRNARSPTFTGAGDVRRELTRHTRVGLAVLPTDGLTLAIDVDLDTADRPTGEQRMLAAGAEYQVSKRIVVRGGARRNLEGTRQTVGAAGASLVLRPGTWLDGHLTFGRSTAERAFGLALRAGW
jgi:hypothetical protein